MAIYRCMICGYVMDADGGKSVEICKNCGMEIAVPPDLKEYGDWYNEAIYLRQKGDFEKAQSVYDKILMVNPGSADAYFGRVMCRYGVRYRKSLEVETWWPDCQVILKDPVCEDSDYLNALSFSDRSARLVYEKIARQVGFAWQKEVKWNYYYEDAEDSSDELSINGSFLFCYKLNEHQMEKLENILRVEAEKNRKKHFFVHKSSYVDDDVVIGGGTRIGHFCHIQRGVRIGRGCVIGQNVHIASNVKIGNYVEIQDNVSLYEGVELEDDVFCGASCVFTSGQRRFLGRPGEREEYKETLVKRGASVGANATVTCGNTIGEYAVVLAGSAVTENVPDHAVVAGIPAKVMKRG